MGELPFFTNLLILLVTARLFGELFERMRQPSMIGEIIAGMILGPSVLDLIHRTEEIKVISELGVFLLVILAGLEIRIDDILKSMRGRNMIISLLAFALPLAGGFAVGHFFGQQVMTSVFIGLCVAITALPVSIRILMDLGQINSAIGKRIISVAIFDDELIVGRPNTWFGRYTLVYPELDGTIIQAGAEAFIAAKGAPDAVTVTEEDKKIIDLP